MAIAPALDPMPQLPTASFAGLWLGLQQVLIGMALGLVMRIVFAAVQTAGEFIGLQMGLSFASLFDPATGANTAVLSRIMKIVAIVLFLAINGPLMMLGGILRRLPGLPHHI